MPPDAAIAPAARLAIPLDWRLPLAAYALLAAALALLARGDWAAMADQWWNSSTYTHVLLVPAIVAWLIAARAPALAQLTPRAWMPGLLLLAPALLAWVLGRFAGLAVAGEAAAIGLLIAGVPLIFGPRIAVALAFPLGYALFLLPLGDEIVPQLQTVTARLTIALVQASGVPARVDGVFIHTPAGLFEIAEACSGIKFLIAMVAFGALAANVCFVSWRRRAAFMVLCVAVPVLANAVRAWGTVFAAQYVGAYAAGGVDHLIYGWIFFAAVIAGTLALAWRWFDRPVDAAVVDAAALAADPRLARLERWSGPPALAVVGALTLTLAAGAWVHAAGRLAAPIPAAIALPPVAGWTRVPYRPDLWWEPRAAGADRRMLGRYADAAGDAVDVFAALYAEQGPAKKPAAAGEGAARPEIGWVWQASAGPIADGRCDRLLAEHGRVRLAQSFVRTGTLTTGSDLKLRLAGVADRVLLRPRPALLLILSVEARPGHDPAAVLDAFRAAIPPVGAWMDGIARGG